MIRWWIISTYCKKGVVVTEFKKFDTKLFKEVLNGTFKEVTIENPIFNTYDGDLRYPDWDLIIQTIEIHLNNERIHKDIKHNLLANLISCVNMQAVIVKLNMIVIKMNRLVNILLK